MVQFDPQMVAQMLMQPIQRASENLGGGPFGIGADAGGSFFVDPEVAARTGYGTAVTGTSFFPGAGIVDAAGGAVDITGQPLPSFSENIREGQFTDAGLQALGVAGDIATIAAPLTGGASALVGAMMKAPRAAQKVTKATDVASDLQGLANEAQKAGSFDNFKKDFTTQIKHGKYYHITSDPNFKIDPDKGPSDTMSTVMTSPSKGGLMITSDLSYWADSYGDSRPFVVEIDMSDVPRGDYEQVSRGQGNEFFIKDASKAKVTKVMTLDEAEKQNEIYRNKLPQNENELKQFYDKTVASDVAGIAKVEPPTEVSKAERQARIAANRREANIARFGYDPNDPETLPDTSYRIQHQARGPNEENPVRLDDLTKSTTGEQAGYPDNFYTSEGQRIYAQGARNANDEYGMANTESYNIIKSVKGNPDAEVTIYRGVPDEDSITDINPGDFVTLSKKYAELHAASGYGRSGDEAGKIISKKVKVKDIYWDQNDVNEFGYFPDSD